LDNLKPCLSYTSVVPSFCVAYSVSWKQCTERELHRKLSQGFLKTRIGSYTESLRTPPVSQGHRLGPRPRSFELDDLSISLKGWVWGGGWGPGGPWVLSGVIWGETRSLKDPTSYGSFAGSYRAIATASCVTGRVAPSVYLPVLKCTL